MNQPTARQSSAGRRVSAVARILSVAAPDSPAISVNTPGSPGRELLEKRIAEKFARQYGARVGYFLPYLVNLRIAGELGAVAGLRPAREDALFLEQYLETPVEQAISRAQKTPVDRNQVVEIGNLVSAMPGAASLLFGILPTVLAGAGLRWVVCTATPQVQGMLDKLGFPTRKVCAADPSVLGSRRSDWGSYYDSRPQVIVGDVNEAVIRAAGNETLRDLVTQMQTPVRRIASILKAAS